MRASLALGADSDTPQQGLEVAPKPPDAGLERKREPACDLLSLQVVARCERQPGQMLILIGDKNFRGKQFEQDLAALDALIGVATGPYAEDQLRASGAHAVLPDLTSPGAVVHAIFVA